MPFIYKEVYMNKTEKKVQKCVDTIIDYCNEYTNCEDGCIFNTDTLVGGTYCRLRQSTPDKWNE